MPASPIHVRVLFTDSHVGVGQSHLVLVEKYDIRGIAPGGHARQSLPLRRQRDEITLQPDHLGGDRMVI